MESFWDRIQHGRIGTPPTWEQWTVGPPPAGWSYEPGAAYANHARWEWFGWPLPANDGCH